MHGSHIVIVEANAIVGMFLGRHIVFRNRLLCGFMFVYTVWPEILAGNLFWRIGGFESNPPIFHPPKDFTLDVIVIAKS